MIWSARLAEPSLEEVPSLEDVPSLEVEAEGQEFAGAAEQELEVELLQQLLAAAEALDVAAAALGALQEVLAVAQAVAAAAEAEPPWC